MQLPQEQATAAVVQAAVAEGILSLQQVEEARRVQAQMAEAGRPSPLLPILSARGLLTPSAQDRLRAVYMKSLSDSAEDATATVALPPPQTPTEASPASEAATHAAPSSRVSLPQRHEAPVRVAHYEVLDELGKGGMGAVYLAHDTKLDRRVALKILLGEGMERPDLLARFRLEAKAVARLKHPNVVQVFEQGEDAQGRAYMAMDYVAGDSLHEILERDGPLLPEEAAEITRALAEALAYAHDQDVLHRDVKPHNVLIDDEGRPLLTDFGLAKLVGDGESLTRTSAVMGTPAYMAPEQARGATKFLDARADVYSLGATLYAMLTGRPPFQGETMANVLVAVVQDEAVPPRKIDPNIPVDLQTICLTCLEKQPEDRYPSAHALAADLRRFLEHRNITAQGRTPRTSLQRWAEENPVAVVNVAVAVGLVLFVILAFAISRGGRTVVEVRSLPPSPTPAKATPTPTASPAPRPSRVDRKTPADRTPGRANASEGQLLERARLLARAGQHKNALAVYDTLLQRAPTHLAGLRERAALREALNDLPGAWQDLEGAIGQAENDTSLREARARVLARQGKRKEALEELQLALRQERNNVRLWRARAALHLALQDLPRADADTSRIVKLAPKDARAWLQRGDVLRLRGRLPQALECYRLATQLKHDLHQAWFGRARVLFRQEEFKAASVAIEQAISLSAQEARYWNLHGRVCEAREDDDAALRSYSRALQIDTGLRKARLNRARLRSERGDMAGAASDRQAANRTAGNKQDKGKLVVDWGPLAVPIHDPLDLIPGRKLRAWRDKATVQRCERTLARNPNNPRAWLNRGRARTAQGRYDAAIKDFTNAIQRHRKLAEAWLWRADARVRLGHHRAARADVAQGLTINRHHSDLWRAQGILNTHAGNPKQGERDLDRAIRLGPRIALNWVARGRAKEAQGRFKAALADYVRALSLKGSRLLARLHRGRVSLILTEVVQAREDFATATRLDSKSALAWAGRAAARLLLGNGPGGLSDARRAVALRGDRGDLWNLLALARARTGDPRGAVNAYARAARATIKVPETLALQGLALLEQGQPQEAQLALNRFVKKEPRHRSTPALRKLLATLGAR